MSARLSAWLRDKDPDFRAPESASSSLPALYADLAAHRSSNRSAFDGSVAWWKRLLSDACMADVLASQSKAQRETIATRDSGSKRTTESGQDDTGARCSTCDRLVLHANEELLNHLTLDEIGRPLGLGTVIQQLRGQTELYPVSEFLSSSIPLHGPSSSSQSLSLRAASLAISPLVWAMSQISISLGLGEQDHDASEDDWRRSKGDWVVWENVKKVSEAILSTHRSNPRLSPLDSLFSMHTFQTNLVRPALSHTLPTSSADGEAAEQLSLSDRDLRVLLKHLSRDMRAAVVQGDVIKMEQEQGQDMQGTPITEHERGIVHVRDTHDKLEAQVADIERRIAERQTRIEKCVKQGSKMQALSYLRSRKALEALRDKRVGTLETLHAVLIKIEQAATDVEVMKAYESSTASLKHLLRDERLQPDRIDANMDEMQETLANADEVRQAVESGQQGMRQAAGVPDVEQDELEAELAALQDEVERERADEEAKQAQQVQQQQVQQQQQQQHNVNEQKTTDGSAATETTTTTASAQHRSSPSSHARDQHEERTDAREQERMEPVPAS